MSETLQSPPAEHTNPVEGIIDATINHALYEESKNGSEIVYMDGEKHVAIPEGRTVRIFTGSLMGCTAIGLIGMAERKRWYQRGNKRVAYMRHANPLEIFAARKGRVPKFPKGKLVDGKAVIMTPGVGEPFGWDEHSETEQAIKASPKSIHEIGQSLAKIVGPENVQVVPYRDERDREENPYRRTMVIDVPSRGTGAIASDGSHLA